MKEGNKVRLISTGNAITEGQFDNRRGWFVGAFVTPDKPHQTNNNVEVKWGIHPKGEKRSSKAIDGDATTMSILIKGSYRLSFENNDDIILSKEGDYTIWSPNIPHEFEAFEDSVVITIRWPSLSKDKN